MKKLNAAILFTLLGLVGCDGRPETATAPPTAPATPATVAAPDDQLPEPPNTDFIGRVWISTTPGSARGSIMVFLPDRTLLMDSCFETFRLSQWGVAGDHIRWIEDSIPIEAEVMMQGKNALRLRIAGRNEIQSYVAATVPFVCPDMPR